MNDIVPQPDAPVSGGAPRVEVWAGFWRNPWLIVVLLALVLAGWQWLETRVRLSETQQEVARRLAESDAVVRETRAQTKLAQEQLAVMQAKVGDLEGKLAESKGQQAMLENLYRDLARNRDEWVLAEVEQGVTMAAQQLQLAGNIQGAMLALQTADARLAGNSRLQLIPLRRALARDLDRLRALPQVDFPGMNLRLESVIAAVDTLPLAVDVRPRDDAQAHQEDPPLPVSVTSVAFWHHVATSFWKELRGLIRIQRFDRDEPALLAPGQAFFLRENLKLRLLNARLALLARDQWTFRKELSVAQQWVDRYFDEGEALVLSVRASLKQLSASEISIELPHLNESLAALRMLRADKERK